MNGSIVANGLATGRAATFPWPKLMWPFGSATEEMATQLIAVGYPDNYRDHTATGANLLL